MINRLQGKVDKGWGYEIIWATNDKYCGKIMIFEKVGSKFSMHFHREKEETWFVNSGKFMLHWIDTKDASLHQKELAKGDTWHNPPLQPHQLEALEPNSEIFEVSTADSVEDNYRVFPGNSQKSNKKIVVNGSFDILHRGHIELLKHAKSLGNYLLVCIDTDSRIKELKGDQRPINSQSDRQLLLESMDCVDKVVLFNSEKELEDILEQYQPDIMVKGSDYKDKRIVGKQFCKLIEFYETVDGYSTTKKIQDITNR
jgi:rfaE bifunctional protein nucleotidyltransferase chain/domain